MSVPPNKPNSQAPEDFTASLRQRAEEALSASVHHASLSQQYLTLSQKFAALAEQSAQGSAPGLLYSMRQLEQEASTGVPAQPIGLPQLPTRTTTHQPPLGQTPTAAATPIASPHFAMDGASARMTPPLAESNAGAVPRDDQRSAAISAPASSARSHGTPFFSPPARISPVTHAAVTPTPLNEPGASTDIPVTPEPGKAGAASEPAGQELAGLEPDGFASPTSAVENQNAEPAAVRSDSKRPTRKAKRPTLSIRKFLDRARLTALEQANRVRVRVRKSDLKPQLRKTSEEIREELKRSRVPATISTLLTVLALFLLALRHLESTEYEELPPLVAGFSMEQEDIEESLPDEPPAEIVGDQLEQPTEEMAEELEPEPEPVPEPVVEPEPEPLPEMTPEVMLTETSLPETPDGNVPTNPEAAPGTDMASAESRSDAGRKMMLEKFGGSAASESAVGHALEWLAERQRSNGSWDFIDVGPCSHPGKVNNPIGGTAYALLPFLAAGQTHKQGQYKKQVQAGLEFLATIGINAPAGYDLRGVVNKADDDEDPNYAYYVHGAATLALCEAYGMTKDRKLKGVAEGAVRFLVLSQDPNGGGWRYNPQQPGSTSATAIQVMALKAAEKAGISIPEATWKGVSYYLDSVSVDREGRYGYEIQKKSYEVSVTSMALLSRMYLGWGRDDGDMRAGVALIDKKGPYDNLYYNYFATQVMKNWGGSEWDRWNGRLRDDLIAWQEKESLVDGKNTNPARGSWTPRDRADYSKAGGRLLTTSLATLTLQVYYRYTPLLPEADSPSELDSENDGSP